MRKPVTGKVNVVASVGLLAVALFVGALLAGCQSAPTSPAASAPTAAAAAAPQQVTVKVGVIPSFTGNNAVMGEPAGKAMLGYIQWINDQGGLAYKDPKTGASMKAKLDVMWEDVAFDGARAKNVYETQKQAGVKAIFTQGGSLVATLAEPASRDKIPIIVSASPTEASLKFNPRYMLYLTNPMNRLFMDMAKYAKSTWKETRAPRLGLTYFDSPTGIFSMTGLPEYAKSIGFEVLPAEGIQEPATDTSIQVKRMLGGKPDFILCSNPSNTVALMMKDGARLGLRGQEIWFVGGGSYDENAYNTVAPSESNGVMSLLPSTLVGEDVPGWQLANTISKKYDGKEVKDQIYLQVQAMERALIEGGIKGALEKVGSEGLTGEAVRSAMLSAKDIETGGIFGPISMTEDSPWIYGKYRAIKYQDRKTIVVTGWF